MKQKLSHKQKKASLNLVSAPPIYLPPSKSIGIQKPAQITPPMIPVSSPEDVGTAHFPGINGIGGQLESSLKAILLLERQTFSPEAIFYELSRVQLRILKCFERTYTELNTDGAATLLKEIESVKTEMNLTADFGPN